MKRQRGLAETAAALLIIWFEYISDSRFRGNDLVVVAAKQPRSLQWAKYSPCQGVLRVVSLDWKLSEICHFRAGAF